MNKKVFIPIITIIGISAITFLLYFPDTRNNLNSVVAPPKIEKKCQTINTTTFIKSYRLKDGSDTYGIVQTSDGGYAITGRTNTPNELCGYDMFWIKADGNGSKQWSKLYNNCSSEGRAITQLTDGNYVVAGDISGEFMTDAEQEVLEAQGDNLVVKIMVREILSGQGQ